MTDVIEVVRRAGSVPRNAWSDTAEGRAARERAFSNEPKTAPRSRFPKWPALVAAALVVGLVAGVAVFARDREQEATPAAEPSALQQLTHGTWTTLRNQLLRDLPDPYSVWTGRQLLVWSPASDRGVAFDPKSRRWSTIAPSGVVDGQPPLWVDGRMVVWAGATPLEFGPPPAQGAAYDPELARWSRIAPAPVRPDTGLTTQAVSAGDALVVIGAQVVCPANADCDTGYLYSAEYLPSTNAWRALPRWPDRSTPPRRAAWDGDRVVVGTDRPDVWALDDGAVEWSRLSDWPLTYGFGLPVMLDDQLLWMLAGAVALPRGGTEWIRLAQPFTEPGFGLRAALPVGPFAMVLGGVRPSAPSAVLDVDEGSWHPMPTPRGAVAMAVQGVRGRAWWTGREVLTILAPPSETDSARPRWELGVYTPGTR